jgi:hypothetical protein
MLGYNNLLILVAVVAVVVEMLMPLFDTSEFREVHTSTSALPAMPTSEKIVAEEPFDC